MPRSPLDPVRLYLAAALLVLSAGTAAGDLLHLRDGRVVETAGAWSIVHEEVRFTHPDGSPGSVALSAVDLERSRAASPAATSEPRIVLYSTSWCPWCRRARELFAAEQVPILERDVEADPAAAREKERLAPGTGVPVVTFGGRVVRGFSEPELRRLAAAWRESRAVQPRGAGAATSAAP